MEESLRNARIRQKSRTFFLPIDELNRLITFDSVPAGTIPPRLARSKKKSSRDIEAKPSHMSPRKSKPGRSKPGIENNDSASLHTTEKKTPPLPPRPKMLSQSQPSLQSLEMSPNSSTTSDSSWSRRLPSTAATSFTSLLSGFGNRRFLSFHRGTFWGIEEFDAFWKRVGRKDDYRARLALNRVKTSLNK